MDPRMDPPQVARTDARVQRTRARVMEAAAALIDEGGPAAVTYSALAERSGVGRATIYRHWPDLRTLWAELRGEMVGRLRAELVGDLATDLRTVMLRMVTALRTQGIGASLITLLERAQWDPETRRQVAEAERINPVRLALTAAVARGELPPDADLDRMCALLLGPLLYRALMTAHDVDEAYALSIADAFLASLGSSVPTG